MWENYKDLTKQQFHTNLFLKRGSWLSQSHTLDVTLISLAAFLTLGQLQKPNMTMQTDNNTKLTWHTFLYYFVLELKEVMAQSLSNGQ